MDPAFTFERLHPLITIKTLTASNRAAFGAGLQELESLAEYPLGPDHFRISHGPSYFRFFDRLGPTDFRVAVDQDRVVASAAAVLRTIRSGKTITRCWYLCDLKVHPEYRGRGLPARLFRQNLVRRYLKCSRGYAVSMNPEGRKNPVVRLVRRLTCAPMLAAGQLHLYSLDHDQVRSVRAAVTDAVGPLSFLSLRDQKDLILKSTGQPLDLLHAQHGPFANPQHLEPRPGATHMFCALADSDLDRALGASFRTSATATLLTHRLTAARCAFILTSDI